MTISKNELTIKNYDQLTGLDVLVLHYVQNKPKEHGLIQQFWFYSYGTSPDVSLKKLVELNLIELVTDYGLFLNGLTVPELKDILRDNGCKVGGRKKELIQRIIEEIPPTLWGVNIEPSWKPTTTGQVLIDNTNFILYTHRRIQNNINVFEIYEDFLNNPNKSSKDRLIDLVNKSIEFQFKIQEFPIDPSFSLLIIADIYQYYSDLDGELLFLLRAYIASFITYRSTNYAQLANYGWDWEHFKSDYTVLSSTTNRIAKMIMANPTYKEKLKGMLQSIYNSTDTIKYFTFDDLYNLLQATITKDDKTYNNIYKSAHKRIVKTKSSNKNYEQPSEPLVSLSQTSKEEVIVQKLPKNSSNKKSKVNKQSTEKASTGCLLPFIVFSLVMARIIFQII